MESSRKRSRLEASFNRRQLRDDAIVTSAHLGRLPPEQSRSLAVPSGTAESSPVAQTPPTASMNDLDDSVLLHILCRVPVWDRIRLTRVCSSWRRVLSRPDAWPTTLDFSFLDLTDSDVISMLRQPRFAHVSGLDLRGMPQLTEEALQSIVLEMGNRLKLLRVWAERSHFRFCVDPAKWNHLVGSDVYMAPDSLLSHLGHCPDLQWLRIPLDHYASDLTRLLRSLDEAKKSQSAHVLRHLDVSLNTSLPPPALSDPVSDLCLVLQASHPQLEALSISAYLPQPREVPTTATYSFPSTLTSLALTYERGMHFAKPPSTWKAAFAPLKSLRSLSLHNCSELNESVLATIATLPLETLILLSVRITPPIHLISLHPLQACVTLRSLYVSVHNLDRPCTAIDHELGFGGIKYEIPFPETCLLVGWTVPCPSLVHLKLQARVDPAVLGPFFSLHPNLETVRVVPPPFFLNSDGRAPTISPMELLDMLPNVRSLCVQVSSRYDALILAKFVEATAQRLQRLESLFIENRFYVKPEPIRAILSGCRSLTQLRLNHFDEWPSGDITHTLSRAGLHRLVHLEMCHMRLAYSHMLQITHDCPNLAFLRIRAVENDSDWLPHSSQQAGEHPEAANRIYATLGPSLLTLVMDLDIDTEPEQRLRRLRPSLKLFFPYEPLKTMAFTQLRPSPNPFLLPHQRLW